jgi:hypothetical protein
MISKYVPTIRPKYALWLFAALLGTTWYVSDPQARPGQTDPGAAPSGGHRPGLGLAQIPSAAGPLVVSAKP